MDVAIALRTRSPADAPRRTGLGATDGGKPTDDRSARGRRGVSEGSYWEQGVGNREQGTQNGAPTCSPIPVPSSLG